jgi:hypothetical protein
MKLLTFLFAFLIAPQAFALHTLHCSSADGLIRRSESEIYGANPISYNLHGTVFREAQLVVGQSNYKEIQTVGDPRAVEGETTTYTAMFTIRRANGAIIEVKTRDPKRVTQVRVLREWLICQEWKNSALD